MNKFVLAAAIIAASAGAASAADLIVDEPAAAVAPAADLGVYFEVLGGASLAGTLEDSGDDFDLPASGAIAGVFGIGTGLDGLSVEGDLFFTERVYGDTDQFTLSTGSAMANLRYTVSLNDTFGLYGAVGLGGIYLHDRSNDGASTYVDSWGLGYQLKAGVTAKVAEHISLVGEVRYANSFEAIDDDNLSDGEQSGTAAVLVGLHFGF